MTDARLGSSPEQLERLSMRDLKNDPYPRLAELRETAPAIAVENNGYRMWLVTRYHDVRKVLAHKSVARDLVANRREINSHCLVREQQRAHLPHGSRRSFFDRDGEAHRHLRNLVGDVFMSARVTQMTPQIEQLVERLLGDLPAGEPIDLMARFARPIATTIISDITGIPAESSEFLPVLETEMITSPVISEIEQAARRLHEFAIGMAALKREQPGDDLFTALLRSREQGEMTEDELTSTYIVLLVGGMEPATAIGTGVHTLLKHPNQLATLIAEPDLFGDSVEEILRFESPFRMVPPRFSLEPIELDEVTIPARELILISPAAANRDPSRFDEPDTFDAKRCPQGHLGFGYGPHRCLGADLGRMETTTALRMLFQRFPRTTLALPDTADWRPGKFMRRLDTLPVILN